VIAADRYQDENGGPIHLARHKACTTAALTGAVDEIMDMQPVAAVVVFTVSGMTAQLLAKNRPKCPILALSSNVSALRRCCLYHGVSPYQVETPHDIREAVALAARACVETRFATSGEQIIVLAGHPFDVPGNTNGLVIVTVP
jgi:pyruvate kinase